MMRAFLAFAMAVTLAACGPKPADEEIKSPSSPTILAPATWDAPPVIGKIKEFQTNAYCTFFAENHSFDYNDEDSWEFVFLTRIAADLPSDSFNGEIMLDGRKRTLELITSKQTDAGEVRQYRTIDAPAAAIEVDMVQGEQGLESTGYTGEIRVTNPEGVTPVRFWGDCGV